MQDQLTRMRAVAERHLDRARPATIIPRVALHVGDRPTPPVRGVFDPSLCLVLQGAKQVVIGGRTLRYDPASAFLATLELPVSGCIIEATPARPYLGATLKLDREALASLILELPPAAEGPIAGFSLDAVTPGLLDAFARLLALLDTPDDIPVLAPMLEREVLYRLLRGPQGGVLRQVARVDSRLGQVRRAIAWMRAHFDETVRIEQLAALAAMSPASFHRHFKAATAMTPLQYQKVLRLQAARQLLAARSAAARAAHTVGYESASQFSREYARMFGAPPRQDGERLRQGNDGGDGGGGGGGDTAPA